MLCYDFGHVRFGCGLYLRIGDSLGSLECGRLSTVPAPHSCIIAHIDQDAGIPGKCYLTHSRHAARVVQGRHMGTLWVTGVHFPDIDLALLVAQCDNLLPRIEAEAHKPYLTLIVLELRNDGARRIAGLELLEALMQLAGLPADDGVLAGLGEHKVAEPLHTVHIIAMNVAR